MESDKHLTLPSAGQSPGYAGKGMGGRSGKGKGLLRAGSDCGLMRQWSPLVIMEDVRQPLASVQESEVAEDVGADSLPQHTQGHGQTSHLNCGRPKKSVAFGLRYSIVIGGENFSEGRRISEVEAQKKAHAIQQWWAERRRLGYDAYAGDGRASSASPSPQSSPELPAQRPRARSVNVSELPEFDGDVHDVFPAVRRRSRTDFSDEDLAGQCDLEDPTSLPPPAGGDSSFGELLKIDAPNLLQDVGPLQILPKQQAYLPSIEDFLNTDPAPRCPRLSQFLASDAPADQSDKRRCWTADVSELQP